MRKVETVLALVTYLRPEFYLVLPCSRVRLQLSCMFKENVLDIDWTRARLCYAVIAIACLSCPFLELIAYPARGICRKF